MTNEFEILKSVELNDNITQRELAERTGLSLGAVNVLIKRLIHKGFIKIEHINARTMRYMLTPKGLVEKARLTYNYIVFSYNYISNIEQRLEKIIKEHKGSAKIILYGEKDELYDIITSKLKSMNEKYEETGDINIHSLYNKEEYMIVTWNPLYAEEEQPENLFNILSQF